MKVILQSDVAGHGKKGQLVEASDGFARNYLLPRGLAVEASAANLNTMKTQNAAKQHKADTELEEAKEAAARLNGKSVKLKAKTGSSGRLFGAVTTKEIADRLKEECGIEINKQKISLSEPVKAVGTYEIRIRLHADVSAKLTLVVEEE